MTWTLGASTIPFKDGPLTETVLQEMADAGVESVELSDYHPGFDFGDVDLRTRIGRWLKELGLHLNSLHIHLRSRDERCDLAALDAADRDLTFAMHRAAVDMAAALGGCILVTHDITLPEPGAPESAERRQAFLEALGQVAGLAASGGVRIALENTGHGYTSDPARLAQLIDDTGAANVGAVIDTGHRNLCGDPAGALRAVGPRLITLHLHDNHGASDEHLLPGRGAIDWTDVVRALGEIDYPGVFMYEISRPEDVAELAANRRQLLAR